MKTPQRSRAIAEASNTEVDLPADFARDVAALAEAHARSRQLTWHGIALGFAFIAMLGLCTAGWLKYAPKVPSAREWLAPIITILESQPWLLLAAAAMAVVHLLNFSRRARTWR